MSTDKPRDEYAGPVSGPESPFPIRLQGPVIRGFGRGSKQEHVHPLFSLHKAEEVNLGIPTANIPPSGLNAYPDLDTGVYFGWTSLLIRDSPSDSTTTTSTSFSATPQIYPSVLSIGYNPFFGNTTRSIEIHILHSFPSDFYGSSLNLLMLGYIRPERSYDGVDALIKDIKFDCEVARRSLERESWKVDAEGQGRWRGWLEDFEWARELSSEEVERVERQVLGDVKDGEKLEEADS